MDNRFVPGSSTPLAGRTPEGYANQRCTLENGSAYRVLKNFPTVEFLLGNVEPHAAVAGYQQWPHFWALDYAEIS
jgi:hypothetical protein